MLAEHTASPPPGGASWLARATASGLRAASRLNVAGLILAVLNIHLAVARESSRLGYPALGAAALLFGAIQLYLMVRIEIDRPLFDALAQDAGPAGLAALDYALSALGWGKQDRCGRSLEMRSRGAIRFLQFTGALAALQLLTAALLLLPG
jgi:hypothetical protein